MGSNKNGEKWDVWEGGGVGERWKKCKKRRVLKKKGSVKKNEERCDEEDENGRWRIWKWCVLRKGYREKVMWVVNRVKKGKNENGK
jgi:hypothetical protein